MSVLNCLQKVNHFQASWCVGRKDRLLRTLLAMKRVHGEDFNFHPEGDIYMSSLLFLFHILTSIHLFVRSGFVLPAERQSFLRQVNTDVSHAKSRMEAGGKRRNLDMSSLWICKPVASSCGKGIKVLTGSTYHAPFSFSE